MAKEWYLMQPKPTYQSGYEDDEINDYANNGFAELLDSIVGTDVYLTNSNILNTNDKQRAIVQSISDEKSTTMKMLINHDLAQIGLYVLYQEKWWLIINSPIRSEFYDKAIIQQCNLLLRFQNNSSTIYEYWGIVENNSPALDDNNTITTLDNKLKLILPYNEHTKKLHINKRLFIDTMFNSEGVEIPMVYQIVDVDSKTKSNNNDKLLLLKLDRAEYNDKDNLQEQIADHIAPVPPPQPVGDCKITYTGNPEVKVGGSYKPFTAVFKNVDGTDNLTVQAVWSLILPPNLIGKITKVDNGNQTKLLCVGDNALIGSTFTLVLDSVDGEYHTEVQIKVVSLF